MSVMASHLALSFKTIKPEIHLHSNLKTQLLPFRKQRFSIIKTSRLGIMLFSEVTAVGC